MDSVAVTVPLRPPTKKMKKRKELDALAAPHAVTRRNSNKRSSQELLTDSSDDKSEYWSVSTRGGRKCRGSRRSRSCPGFLRACSAFLACASVLATATLIWLFIDVHQQLTALRTKLDQVVAGSAAVPDILQNYHSLSKYVQNNQTNIFANITEIKLQITNFTTQLSSIQHGLNDVQERIRAAPELVNVPNELKSLSTEISTWGSKITDLQSTKNSSKEAIARIQNAQEDILKNITTIDRLLMDISNTRQQHEPGFSNESKAQIDLMSSTINELVANLTLVNDTLTRNVTWLGDDLLIYSKKLDALDEKTTNFSTKVMTLDGACAKIAIQQPINKAVEKLTADVNSAKSLDTELAMKLKSLEISYNLLLNSSNAMLASINELQNSKSNATALNTGTIQSSLNPASVEDPKEIVTEAPISLAGEISIPAGEVSQNNESSQDISKDQNAGAS